MLSARFEPAAAGVRPGAWQPRHPDGSGFTGMDFDPAPAETADLVPRHEYSSASPDTRLRRLCTVMRRRAADQHEAFLARQSRRCSA
ncbi:hypothetical protein ACH4E7_30840 [Kitasatospora sp. NPDC018058]|uniref:hypothetical protein n=1 Tax=Kitasatospora sp. NPDC018058 TaxID=3364025 RepID=UPI0037C019A3